VLQTTHWRSAEAVQPTICWPTAQSEAEHVLGQAVSRDVRKVEADEADANVPSAHAVHVRSADAEAAALKKVPSGQLALCVEAQAASTEVAMVEGVDEAEKVPAAQAVHMRSAVGPLPPTTAPDAGAL
jgi:hypothetical protein